MSTSSSNSRAPTDTRLRPGYIRINEEASAESAARVVTSTWCNSNDVDESFTYSFLDKEYCYFYEQKSTTPCSHSIRILQLLGSGDFGSVYLTQDQNVLSALKVMPLNAQSAAELLLHVKASSLTERSPHVLLAYDYFKMIQSNEDGCCSPLLCLKLDLAWTTLSDVVRLRNGLEEDRLVDIFGQLADGLAYLHHQVEIIHGDFKTDNVLLTFSGRALIADFGSATCLKWGNSLPAGQPPLRFGSRFHAPPESCQPGVAVWHVADWFAFGLCAFQTFFGGRLVTDNKSGFAGPDPNYLTIVERWLVLGHAREFCQNRPIKSYPSKNFAHFLRSLLCSEPGLRLGASGAAQVQSHPLFNDYDWNALRRAEYRQVHQRQPLTAALLPSDIPALVDVRAIFPSSSVISACS